MAIATCWGLVSTALTFDFFLAFAFAGYFERLTVEGWKILRAKRPGKFVSPGMVKEWGSVNRYLSRGSSASLRPSPTRLNASTAPKMASPGNVARLGSEKM